MQPSDAASVIAMGGGALGGGAEGEGGGGLGGYDGGGGGRCGNPAGTAGGCEGEGGGGEGDGGGGEGEGGCGEGDRCTGRHMARRALVRDGAFCEVAVRCLSPDMYLINVIDRPRPDQSGTSANIRFHNYSITS